MSSSLSLAFAVALASAQMGLIWRLFRVGALREHGVFALHLGWSVVASAGLLALVHFAGNGVLYGKAWLTSQLLTCAIALCALLSILNIFLQEYRGFRRLGQRLINICLVCSGLMIALLWLPFEGLDSTHSFLTFEGRTAYVSLVLTAVLFGLFAAYFRLRASRNTLTVFASMAAILMGKAALYSVAHYASLDWINSIQQGVLWWELVCLSTAVVLLSRHGNVVAPLPPNLAASGAEQSARRRLHVANEALIRIMRE